MIHHDVDFFPLKIITRVDDINFTRQVISCMLFTIESLFCTFSTSFELLNTNMYVIGLSDGAGFSGTKFTGQPLYLLRKRSQAQNLRDNLFISCARGEQQRPPHVGNTVHVLCNGMVKILTPEMVRIDPDLIKM